MNIPHRHVFTNAVGVTQADLVEVTPFDFAWRVIVLHHQTLEE